MNTRLGACLASAILCQCSTAWAATLIEERDSESTVLMYIEKGKMRTETPGENGYALLDLRGRKMFMIDPAEKNAVDMSSMMFPRETGQASAGGRTANPALEKIGSGPEIAGYTTEHYALKANGVMCQELFTSKKAFKDSGWAELWNDVGESMKDMAAAEEDADDCDVAEAELIDPAEIGWPLKTIQADGETTEVVRIERDVVVPPGGFEIPAGYTVISMQEMFSGALIGGPPGPGTVQADEQTFGIEERDDPEEEAAATQEGAEDESLTDQVKGLFQGLQKGFGN